MSSLSEILTQAMQLEKDGADFYLKAAGLSSDAETRAMFEQLAQDEKAHLSYIERQYAALECGEDWCSIPELGKVTPADVNAPIFPADLRRVTEISTQASLEDALLFALNAEDASIKLYKDGAARADHAEAQQLFLQLVSAETTHFTILLQRYETLYPYPR